MAQNIEVVENLGKQRFGGEEWKRRRGGRRRVLCRIWRIWKKEENTGNQRNRMRVLKTGTNYGICGESHEKMKERDL